MIFSATLLIPRIFEIQEIFLIIPLEECSSGITLISIPVLESCSRTVGGPMSSSPRISVGLSESIPSVDKALTYPIEGKSLAIIG